MTDGTDRPPVRNREWIADILDEAEFVQWDRFVVEQPDRGQHIRVYGWIERDSDDYKDFVIVRIWPDSETFGFTTSSDHYSEELHRIWFGEETLDDHNPCRRVEHAFDIENAVELKEQATLTDGGTVQDAPDRSTVYVEDTPRRMSGNVLIDGADGQCIYVYAGIENRCQNDAVAHTFIEHGGEQRRVEMCAEHTREDVPEPPTAEQQELVPDGGQIERTECWQCGYNRPTFEACPECGSYGGGE